MSGPLSKTEEIVQKAKSLGADEVIAKTVVGKYRQTRFSNNQIDITVAWNDYRTAIISSWNKRVVATTLQNFQNIDKQLKQLAKIARVSKENPTFSGFAKGKFTYALSHADKQVINLDDPSTYISDAIEAATTVVGSDVNCGGILASRFEDIFLVSSEGPEGRDSRSAIELSIRVFSQREASGHSVECSSTLHTFNPSNAGWEAGTIAKLARNPKAGAIGVYDVIVSPLFAGSMLGMWTSMVSAFKVMIQQSIFVNKLGKKVAPDIVTLRDNPASYSIAHRSFDDEGVPTKENIFVEKGLLTTYLHNTSTAKIFNTETTGNAGLIVPHAWNIEMDPGDSSKDEMITELKKGLFLTNTWYTRFQNYARGEFSTMPRDGMFLIENGAITQSLKDLRVSENAANMLNNIATVSEERKHVHWWGEAAPPSLAPYLLIRDVHITRSQ